MRNYWSLKKLMPDVYTLLLDLQPFKFIIVFLMQIPMHSSSYKTRLLTKR